MVGDVLTAVITGSCRLECPSTPTSISGCPSTHFLSAPHRWGAKKAERVVDPLPGRTLSFGMETRLAYTNHLLTRQKKITSGLRNREQGAPKWRNTVWKSKIPVLKI